MRSLVLLVDIGFSVVGGYYALTKNIIPLAKYGNLSIDGINDTFQLYFSIAGFIWFVLRMINYSLNKYEDWMTKKIKNKHDKQMNEQLILKEKNKNEAEKNRIEAERLSNMEKKKELEKQAS